MKKNCKDFLMEIDVEELPCGYVRSGIEQIERAFLKKLRALRIDHGKTYSAGTAKKLIVYIKDVSISQKKLSKEIIGPPKSIAFDESGKPTKQALGFVKSQKVSIADLKIKETLKGEYIVVEKRLDVYLTEDILKEIVPRIIKETHFPKTMRWDNSGVRFARPIEGLIVLFGNKQIPIKLGNVPHKKLSFKSAGDYLRYITKRYMIDPDKRKEGLRRLILKTAKRLKLSPYIDENLLEEVNFMVTSPRILVGGFDKRFLVLPEEVLKASMSKYQRLFPVLRKSRIVNKFVAIIDGRGRDLKKVRKNYENILYARLKDSLFFFNEDMKRPFCENIFRLKDLIFQKDLGNMFNKIERMEELCSFICERLGLGDDLRGNIKRAARLSKIDLVSHMVGEFPSLQGVIGRVYALKSGEKDEVAEAIREHYLPQGADESMSLSLGGAIVGISDRLDNVVGLLGIGEDINASFDPFGIRRNTQGLIQIIRDNALRFKIDEVIQKAMDLYGGRLKVDAGAVRNKICDYIKDRIKFLSGDVEPNGLKEAVLKVECYDIADIFKRISELSSISSERFFLEAAKVVERTSNILNGAKGEEIGRVNEGLFKEDLEFRLWKIFLDTEVKIEELIAYGRYKEVTKEYAKAFFKVIHDFFDNVLVNVEDNVLRLNRLALMKAINMIYSERVADLSVLPQIVVE